MVSMQLSPMLLCMISELRTYDFFFEEYPYLEEYIVFETPFEYNGKHSGILWYSQVNDDEENPARNGLLWSSYLQWAHANSSCDVGSIVSLSEIRIGTRFDCENPVIRVEFEIEVDPIAGAEPEFILRTSAELRTLEDWYRFKVDQLDEGMQRVAELTHARLSEWSEDETDTDETV